VVFGNAADSAVLSATNVAEARRLVVAIPEPFEAGQVVAQARAANAGLDILARAHSDTEMEHLGKCGATHSIMGEREIARCMLGIVLDDQRKEGQREEGQREEGEQAASAA
jgi:Kef-type K+ transport systems, predicted NAD-binding component